MRRATKSCMRYLHWFRSGVSGVYTKWNATMYMCVVVILIFVVWTAWVQPGYERVDRSAPSQFQTLLRQCQLELSKGATLLAEFRNEIISPTQESGSLRGRPQLPLLVHVSYEAQGVASFGGLGAAVSKMLAGHESGAVVLLPYFGMLRNHSSAVQRENLRHLFSHRVACGLPSVPITEMSTDAATTPPLVSTSNVINASFEFWVTRGPGDSLAVLVQPPSELDYFAQVRSRQDLYPVPGPESGAVALRVFAQGAAIALAALCPATPAAGGGVDVDVGGGPSCLGAVFHGANMGRALIAARQLPADPRQVLQVSPELRMLYFIHDGLSEISQFLLESDLQDRLGAGAARALGAGPVPPEEVWSPLRLAKELRRAPLPGLEAMAVASTLHHRTGNILGLTALAALHADAVSPVSSSLARALLPGGEVLSLGHTSRALLAMHRAGRLWAIAPAAPEPDPALGLPSVDQGKLDPEGAAQRLWAAKARARTELLGEGFSGELAPAGSAEGRRFVVLFVGRFEANKGAAMVVPVGREVCEQGGHTVVMSTGPQDEVGRRAWEDLHAWREASPQCVTLVGGRDQVRGRLARAAADVCVVPSWLEGFSTVAVEALQHGCFLVASDTVGLREHVQLGNAGDVVSWPASMSVDAQAQAENAAYVAGPRSGSLDHSVVSSSGQTHHASSPLQMWESAPRQAHGLPPGCVDSSAASFRLDASSRLPAHREAALSSARTRAAAMAAMLGGVENLRRCGVRGASRAAVRSLGRLPTPRSVARRIADALHGRWAQDQAPVRDGRLARMRLLGHVFAPFLAARRVAQLHVSLAAPHVPDAPRQGLLIGRLRQDPGVLQTRGDRGFEVIPRTRSQEEAAVAAVRWIGIRSHMPARQPSSTMPFYGATVGVRLQISACKYLEARGLEEGAGQHVRIMAELSAFGHGALQGHGIELHHGPDQCCGHLYVLLDLSLAIPDMIELVLIVQALDNTSQQGSSSDPTTDLGPAATGGIRAPSINSVGISVNDMELLAGLISSP